MPHYCGRGPRGRGRRHERPRRSSTTIVEWLNKQKIALTRRRRATTISAIRSVVGARTRATSCACSRTIARGARSSSAMRSRPCVPSRGSSRACGRRRCRVEPFALGESRKRLATVERVLDALLAAGVERGTLIVGVGGGIAGDLFGFAARRTCAAFRTLTLRRHWLPWSTPRSAARPGVNLRGGKNIAGTFADPVAVFCACRRAAHAAERGIARGPRGDREGRRSSRAASSSIARDALRRIRFGVGRGPRSSRERSRSRRWWSPTTGSKRGARETLNLGHTFAHAHRTRVAISHVARRGRRARACAPPGLLALRTGRFSREEHLRVLSLLTLLRHAVAARRSPPRRLSTPCAAIRRRARDACVSFCRARSATLSMASKCRSHRA